MFELVLSENDRDCFDDMPGGFVMPVVKPEVGTFESMMMGYDEEDDDVLWCDIHV